MIDILPRLFTQVSIPPTVSANFSNRTLRPRDDRAGRTAAIHCGLQVIGTVGLLERAAARGLLDLPYAMSRLQQTNARLDPTLIRAALERDKARKQPRSDNSR